MVFKILFPNIIILKGLDCNTKTIRLDDKNELKLLIWDTAGQEKYRCLISNYFKDSHGALIVFDLTVKESFEGIKKIWLENLSKNAPEKICKVVLANKCDKLEDIKVTDEEINEFEKEFNIKCFKTSAKDNIGIEESFEYLAHKMKETFFFMTSIENKNEMEYYFSNLDNKKKGIKIEKGKHNVQKSISSCCE